MKRPCHFLLIIVAILCVGVGVVAFHARHRSVKWHETVEENQRIAAVLGLSDPVFSTEGRYLRHLSASDLFSAFQDTPSGFDLFPSGAFFKPPLDIGTSGLTQQAEKP